MNPIVTMKMKNKTEIKFELFPNKANNAVNGLIEAIQIHAFDHMAIERVVPNFVLQPWCDESKLGEFYQYVCDKEFDDSHIFDEFCVGLAGDGDKISVPSCFFITLNKAYHLNGKFACVGKVISGFEEIRRIEHVELIDVPNDDGVAFKTPLIPEIIETITIDLNGYVQNKCMKYIEKSA